MIIVISSAKTLDFKTEIPYSSYSSPVFLDEAEELINELRELNIDDIAKTLGVSYNLANLNHQRFFEWQKKHNPENSRQAIFAYMGDVFRNLNISDFSIDELKFLNNHLRIFSGLYGLVRPMDLIQPYRLGLGDKLASSKGNNIYEFWGSKITDNINNSFEVSGDNVIINLASKEYFKAVKKKELNGRILTLIFKQFRNDKYVTTALLAKRARGMMCRFIAKHKITNIEHIKAFDSNGYFYNKELSSENDWVFCL